MPICEKCGKEHDGSFGSGRFCSRSCANSRIRTEEVKIKISDGVKRHINETKPKFYSCRRIKDRACVTNYMKKIILNWVKYITRINFIETDELKLVPNFPDYATDINGNVYKILNMEKIKPFNSDGYYQICIYDINGNRYVKGVHQVVAMTFLKDFYNDCVVHHLDENKHNNAVYNLRIYSNSEHSRLHADPSSIIKYSKEVGPPNKGRKMSEEFKQHCKESARRRWDKERQNKNKENLL